MFTYSFHIESKSSWAMANSRSFRATVGGASSIISVQRSSVGRFSIGIMRKFYSMHEAAGSRRLTNQKSGWPTSRT